MEEHFDKDIEILKITLLSEELRVRAFTKIAFFLSIFVALLAGDFALLGVTDRTEITVFGLALTFGLVYMLRQIRGVSSEYRERLSRIDPLLKSVKTGVDIGDFNELLKKFVD